MKEEIRNSKNKMGLLMLQVLKQVEGAVAVMFLQAATQAPCLPFLGARLLWWEQPQGPPLCLQDI